MKVIRIFSFSFCLLLFCLQDGIAQEPSAVLNLESTTEGFLPPRMSTTQRNAIENPADGMVIFNTSTGLINYYDIFQGWIPLEPLSNLSLPPINETSLRYCVSPIDFKATYSVDEFYSGFVTGGIYITNGGIGRLSSHLPFPVGTYIEGLEINYIDESTTAEMSIGMQAEILNGTSFASSTDWKIQTGVVDSDPNYQQIYHDIDHTLLDDRGYYLDIYSSNWSADLLVKGICVDYVLPSNTIDLSTATNRTSAESK